MSEERRSDERVAPVEPPEPAPPGEPRRLPIVCRMLRTKMTFGAIDGMAHDWREGRSTTAAYWCLRTMEAWGPDDRPAHASPCRSGRACFESEDALDDV